MLYSDKIYEVFDDLLSVDEQKILYNYANNSEIKWNETENITGNYGGKKNTNKFPAKVHPQIDCKNEQIDELIKNIQRIISKKIGLEFVTTYRWKINHTSPLNYEYNPIDLLHYDRIAEHIAAVYYINDTDGDTCIYRNKFGDNAETYMENFDNVNLDSFELLTKISPKMGRCLVFDGRYAHHANYPTKGSRYILNLNFVAKPLKTNSLL
jgi:hypothetical protein